MPFRVKDMRKRRYEKVLRIAMDDLSAGVMLAAVDFEWTCRRAILALAEEPTPSIKNAFSVEKWCGDGVKDAWRKLLPNEISLAEVFNAWAKAHLQSYVIWSDLQWANTCRNRLVHAGVVELRPDVGWACFHIFEKACDVMDAFVKSHGRDLFSVLSRQSGLVRLIVSELSCGKQEGASDGEVVESGVRLRADYLMGQLPKKIFKRGDLRIQDVLKLSAAVRKTVRRA